MKGAAFPANMAKKFGLNHEKHSNSYGYSDLVRTSKSRFVGKPVRYKLYDYESAVIRSNLLISIGLFVDCTVLRAISGLKCFRVEWSVKSPK